MNVQTNSQLEQTGFHALSEVGAIGMYGYEDELYTRDLYTAIKSEYGQTGYDIFAAADRRLYIRDNMQRRASGGISAAEVHDTALERYFLLLQAAQSCMSGLFTEAEISMLLDAYCNARVASIDIQFVDSDFADHFDAIQRETGSPVAILILKLRSLTLLQRFALVDALEQIWRNSSPSSVATTAQRIGLPLGSAD
ncbi:hypothetical protein [Azoarcus sp. KH32C]|uniref:hypothetical protein n=1 Tax=Azoarcus sp. KH32C TaxID=748247 RepID=UPI00023866F4|nr:hypothetical protein [Azoarcus sp. KH32C]BAL23694.1 hypothetical protein AZKH_1372 [Azoarcus sp. KH32C]